MSPALTSSVAGRFESLLGNAYIQAEPEALRAYAVDGVSPFIAVQPETAEQAAAVVKVAVEEKLSLIASGARTSLGIGMPPSRYDLALDMTRVRGVTHYDAGDLTISVNAGTPLTEIAGILAARNQFLPLAVPFFAHATVGGAIAAGLDSPLRHFYGTARDFMIGAEFVDGTGAMAKSGGRVVKNVTGYDFHKLLNGSLGSLAVISKVNFRTFPVAPAQRGFLASFTNEAEAFALVRQIVDSPLAPTVLEVLSPEFAQLFWQEKSPLESLRLDVEAWTVLAGFEGSGEVCERYRRDLSQAARIASARDAIALHDSQFLALLHILREAPAALSRAAAAAVTMRFVTLPARVVDLVRALRSFAGSCGVNSAMLIRSGSIVYLVLLPRDGDEHAIQQAKYFWHGVASLRGQIACNGAILFAPAKWKAELNVWAYADGAVELGQRVKRAFDPGGTFACGRFVGGM